ncbi:MAG: diaminopimelate epimerase [Ghiorsea sp.]
MNIPFVKMQAQGNDFVILNGLQDRLPALDSAMISQICNQHWGIGCDQLLVLQQHDHADALMLIFNADGSQAANCGNGLRCVGDVLMRKTGKKQVTIALADRLVSATQTALGIAVNMGKAVVEHIAEDYTDINMGNPHRVYFSNAQACPERNVEIIADYDAKQASIRIIERGTGETLACGSGACATAAAIWQKLNSSAPLSIVMSGGVVKVALKHHDIYLEGSVKHVFAGEYALSTL